MNLAMGVGGEGACQRRPAEFPPVLQLCFGALGEASQDVHNLVAVLAASRVRQGAAPQNERVAHYLKADGTGGREDQAEAQSGNGQG